MRFSFSRIIILLFVFNSIFFGKTSAQFYKNILKAENKENTISSLSSIQYAELLKKIQADLAFFSDDKLQNRKIGSDGERVAGMYIQSRMSQDLLLPFQKSFRHSFQVVIGKTLTPETRMKIGNKFVFVPEDAFPLEFCPPAELEDFFLKDAKEAFTTWLLPLFPSNEQASNPNFDWELAAYKLAVEAQQRGAKALFLYDEYGSQNLAYSKDSKKESLNIPVIVLKKKVYDSFIKDMISITPFSFNIKFKNDYLEGNNVIGFLDNKAPRTVIIAAHYDNNFISKKDANKDVQKDELSGIAGMLALAKIISQSNFTKYNYIFAALSGNEFGTAGSKALIKELGPDTNKIAYVLNLGKLGSLKSDHKLYIEGAESSKMWDRFLKTNPAGLKLSSDPAFSIPSDAFNFYDKSIPSLSFSTENPLPKVAPSIPINYDGMMNIVDFAYQMIGSLNQVNSPRFQASVAMSPSTEELPSKIESGLGVIPDSEYEGIGIRVKDLKANSPAAIALLKAGDILFQIGEYKCNNIQELDQVLRKFKPGSKTKVKIKRGATVQTFNLIL